jgi:hypothetical protein
MAKSGGEGYCRANPFKSSLSVQFKNSFKIHLPSLGGFVILNKSPQERQGGPKESKNLKKWLQRPGESDKLVSAVKRRLGGSTVGR